MGVFRDTTIAIGVARILSYIKEGIKIQLEGVNLHGIELRAGRNIMWKVAISSVAAVGKDVIKAVTGGGRISVQEILKQGYRRPAWGFLNCEGDHI